MVVDITQHIQDSASQGLKEAKDMTTRLHELRAMIKLLPEGHKLLQPDQQETLLNAQKTAGMLFMVFLLVQIETAPPDDIN